MLFYLMLLGALLVLVAQVVMVVFGGLGAIRRWAQEILRELAAPVEAYLEELESAAKVAGVHGADRVLLGEVEAVVGACRVELGALRGQPLQRVCVRSLRGAFESAREAEERLSVTVEALPAVLEGWFTLRAQMEDCAGAALKKALRYDEAVAEYEELRTRWFSFWVARLGGFGQLEKWEGVREG